MEQYRVKVNLLNKRTKPEENTTDKSTVSGQVKENDYLDLSWAAKLPNGDWYTDGKGGFYWGGGLEEIISPKVYPWWITDFGIEEIWQKTRGNNVKIIVLDSGFSEAKKMTFNKVTSDSIFSNNDDFDGHGTLMASIIASNEIGVAPDSEIVSVKIFNNNTNELKSAHLTNNWENLIAGLNYAKQIIKEDLNEFYIINCSCAGFDLNNATKTEIQNLINELVIQFKALVICAVGNQSFYGGVFPYPACFDNTISIAAFRKDVNSYKRLKSSNYWNGINLTCPGDYSIIKNVFSNQYPDLIYEGSSEACAFASGLIALFISNFKPLDPFNEICGWMNDSLWFDNVSETYNYIPITLHYKILNRTKLISKFNLP